MKEAKSEALKKKVAGRMGYKVKNIHTQWNKEGSSIHFNKEYPKIHEVNHTEEGRKYAKEHYEKFGKK